MPYLFKSDMNQNNTNR